MLAFRFSPCRSAASPNGGLGAELATFRLADQDFDVARAEEIHAVPVLALADDVVARQEDDWLGWAGKAMVNDFFLGSIGFNSTIQAATISRLMAAARSQDQEGFLVGTCRPPVR